MIETKGNELKEMLTKKKLAKSKKKKLELVRECMKILENVDEKKTFEDDLAMEIKKIRKNYFEDDPEDSLLTKEDDGHIPGHESKPKSSRLKKLKTPMKSQKKKTIGKNFPASKLVSRLNLKPMPNVKRIAAMLEKEDPNHLTIAKNCGRLPKLKIISKPSKVYSSSGVYKPTSQQWNWPPHQWDSRTGIARQTSQSDADI